MMNSDRFIQLQGVKAENIVSDESTLRRLFGDRYDKVVALEKKVKSQRKDYYGDEMPFVMVGLSFRYESPDITELKFPTTSGKWLKMSRADWESEVNRGVFNGLPSHMGHTNYPVDRHELKPAFGSVLLSENTPGGTRSYFYILPSEPDLRIALDAGNAMGFDKSPYRDLSMQFMAAKVIRDRVKKIDSSSIDLVYKNKAQITGSGFESIVANQKHSYSEEKMDKEQIKQVLDTVTMEDFKENENLKRLSAKLQVDATEGMIKLEEIPSIVEKNEKVRKEVVALQSVKDNLNVELQNQKSEHDKFYTDAKSFLTGKGMDETKAIELSKSYAAPTEYDLEKFKSLVEANANLGYIELQKQGTSEGSDPNKSKSQQQANVIADDSEDLTVLA